MDLGYAESSHVETSLRLAVLREIFYHPQRSFRLSSLFDLPRLSRLSSNSCAAALLMAARSKRAISSWCPDAGADRHEIPVREMSIRGHLNWLNIPDVVFALPKNLRRCLFFLGTASISGHCLKCPQFSLRSGYLKCLNFQAEIIMFVRIGSAKLLRIRSTHLGENFARMSLPG